MPGFDYYYDPYGTGAEYGYDYGDPYGYGTDPYGYGDPGMDWTAYEYGDPYADMYYNQGYDEGTEEPFDPNCY
jgi:hypothetical protein